MSDGTNASPDLLEKLNAALAWEMRATVLYEHYAAYVKGIHRLHLKPFFETEAAESTTHGRTVREQIVKLGGVATKKRDATEIVHTTDYKVMLQEAFKTEQKAAEGYEQILAISGEDSELFDTMQQISFQEQRSIEELTQLLD
ncbi:MAG: ferritin-like domain-containing protein [Planctomycetota bacterium]|nr:ferritin-like domain-containing protein [Planctomycetota bacterium]